MAPQTYEQSVAEEHRVMPPVVTVVVVWANVGAGFEALKHFTRMNPGLLIVACRSEEKGKEVVLRFQDTNYSGILTSRIYKCTHELDRLDILAEKAGMSPFGRYDVVEDWVTYSHTNNLSYPPSSKDD
ncbi:uncharacterized protein ARMOST_16086 [Armillaria ostoyae]|uniref:Ketoreductase (KR) domain-containing protein n=1 Tax=Armillaria ostoyae TaxID=47428 RepID=A0A284RV63_ARMOS|nr:uncharacterized protein ARMOST_16086 [Armillaria ostoyae]